MHEDMLSRRDFLKKSVLATAAVAAAPIALAVLEPQVALAADGITCDVYCEPTETIITNVIGIKKAYLTNPATPASIFSGPWPNEPVEDNATLVTDDSGMKVYVDLVNTTFTLTDIHSDATGGGAHILPEECVKADDGHYTRLVVSIDALGETYQFDATEYANLSPVSGDKKWPVNICVRYAQ